MRTLFVAGATALMLATAKPAHAQLVLADVVVHGGPVHGRVVIGDWDTHPDWLYERGRVVVIDRAPRAIVVERFPGRKHRHWDHRRSLFRYATVWYRDGRYYDRPFRGCRPVQVIVADGRYYHDYDGRWDRDHDRDRRGGWDRDDDGRDRDRDDWRR
ncbi:MAG: hypothetical protein ACOY71_14180 [Gemmatimonadota bacterium]